MESDDDIGGLPFFGQDDDHLVLRDSRLNDMFQEERWDGLGIVTELIIFSVVTAEGMEMADPLTPAMEDELTASGGFFTLEMRVPDKEEMGGKTFLGEGVGEVGNPHSESSRLGINIRSFKR
jgi:hypothetical protein